MFAVDDIDDTIARLRTHGAELLGELAQYESIYRGRAGIIVALAEQIGKCARRRCVARSSPFSVLDV